MELVSEALANTPQLTTAFLLGEDRTREAWRSFIWGTLAAGMVLLGAPDDGEGWARARDKFNSVDLQSIDAHYDNEIAPRVQSN